MKLQFDKLNFHLEFEFLKLEFQKGLRNKMLETEKNIEGHPKWTYPSVYFKIIVTSKSYRVMV